MARIRRVEISSFRGIRKFCWLPHPGVNCLIGPGDSGKSTILAAIDLCLGVRRNVQFSDADFYKLDVTEPIRIATTLGELHDKAKTIDTYGLYVGGFNNETGELSDEPEVGTETVLTVELSVGSDLEPRWTLVSKRAEAQGQSRSLTWSDRVQLAPTRLGASPDYNLSWRRGSILNRLTEERPDAGAALAEAARSARAAFGEDAKSQLGDTLAIVHQAATELGIPVGQEVRALLDAHSASSGDGTISLHDDSGVPLRGLGLGSTRLLIAGLQKCAAESSSIILVDELEYGLEPHRIIRLVDALGAKVAESSVQVVLTTHSPTAVRELSGDQLFIVRRTGDEHEARLVGSKNEIQGTIRLFPDAMLAPSVLVCEGASEVGFVRGLDLHRSQSAKPSITALGLALVDGGGTTTGARAKAFKSLGYRTAILRDNDDDAQAAAYSAFVKQGGTVIAWREGRCLEDELFQSLSDRAVVGLVQRAIELVGEAIVDDNIRSVSNGAYQLADALSETSPGGRDFLATAAQSGRGWFKTVTAMQLIANEVVGPDLDDADPDFGLIVARLFEWAAHAEG